MSLDIVVYIHVNTCKQAAIYRSVYYVACLDMLILCKFSDLFVLSYFLCSVYNISLQRSDWH